ncbi:hypothetical protein TcCL_NonESM00404 [Trypanosoma cruzi]|uniref:Uncharacterized protein n=1 Tax=Trypanosoma cruzi (strain CL Brener) TaxID=353153 RepID=Q4DQB6_TRYCC|nr:hypothetical protein Tc00.1047053511827.50 [Trypanosoma cruzi]EAN94713.1 hypothetical protein Tc00.1047053511827.50 [Trypanosoma cruzi]RNC49541.1 hypothetical protein TcCL_NonESM00404 [Trypanosoma cruzi]|eukprot:XP_816564.1 hypothetical protein [Trypanosoma cruzi strain CL Brener]
MLSSARALLARLEIYRGDRAEEEEKELQPLPEPPRQHPPLAVDAVLTRRVALLRKRLNALREENGGLRREIEAAERTIATHSLPTAAILMLGFQCVLEECSRALQSEGEHVHETSLMRDALVHALQQLYSLKSFMKTLDSLHEAYRQVQREGVQLVLENYVGGISEDDVRTAAAELIVRYDVLEERRMQSVSEYNLLQRSFANAVGVAVSRAMLHVGKSKQASQQTLSLLSATQQVVLGALDVFRHLERDVATSFARGVSVNAALLKRLHAISLSMVPQHTAPTTADLQAMTDGVADTDIEQRRDGCYDACVQSLQAALFLLVD